MSIALKNLKKDIHNHFNPTAKVEKLHFISIIYVKQVFSTKI